MGIALGRSAVAHTIAILTCVAVPAETVNATGLGGLAAQCAATLLMLRRWTPALSPATRVICSYPGKTAGTNFGATPSTLKLYPLGSKSTFLTTLTVKAPVAAEAHRGGTMRIRIEVGHDVEVVLARDQPERPPDASTGGRN